MYYKCVEHYLADTSICISMNKDITRYIEHGPVTGHHYYFDNNLKFINIPKCASTAVAEQKPELGKKFTVIRQPYDRLRSCFKHVIEFENISMAHASAYLIGSKTIQNNPTANAMMHFIPASFFIQCSRVFCNKPFTVYKLESLQFGRANENPVTRHDDMISRWIDDNQEFIQNFYAEDIELYNAG